MHLEVAIGRAQPLREFLAAVLDRGDAVLAARDRRQHVDEALVRRIALALERAQRFGGGARFGFGSGDRIGFAGHRLLEQLEFLARARGVGFGGRALLLQLLDLALPPFVAFFDALALAARELDAALEFLDVAAQRVERFGTGGDSLLGFGQRDALGFDGEFALGEVRLERGDAVLQLLHLTVGAVHLRLQLGALVLRERQFEDAQRLLQALVLRGLLGLALERADLALDLAEHVVHAEQVLLRRLHLALRLAAARLELADAGGFLDQDAPLVGLGRHDSRRPCPARRSCSPSRRCRNRGKKSWMSRIRRACLLMR